MDGLGATKFIVRNIPADRRPRIVAMSANVMREHVAAAMAAGADQYIEKPFAPSALRATLEQFALGAPASKSIKPPNACPSNLLSPERIHCHLEVDGTGEFLKELTASFRTSSQELLSRLTTAVQAQDNVAVSTLVHEYSGMCAVIGAEELSRLLLALKKICRSGNTMGAALLIEQCRAVQDQTIAALGEVHRTADSDPLEAAQPRDRRPATRPRSPKPGRKAR